MGGFCFCFSFLFTIYPLSFNSYYLTFDLLLSMDKSESWGGKNGARPHLRKEDLQDCEGFILYGTKRGRNQRGVCLERIVGPEHGFAQLAYRGAGREDEEGKTQDLQVSTS